MKYCCKDLKETTSPKEYSIRPDPKGDGFLWTHVCHFEKPVTQVGVGLRWYYCPFCGKKLNTPC